MRNRNRRNLPRQGCPRWGDRVTAWMNHLPTGTLGVLLCGVLGLGLWLGFPPFAQAATTELTWQDSPAASSDSYARATQPGQIRFPRDLGSHPEFQTEWWYYTGNLETETGRPFGYQLTFFRSTVTPQTVMPQTGTQTQGSKPSKAATSAWRSNQLYSAHFTLSDIEANRFYPYERYSRSGAALAGASSQPYEVWLEDWSVTEVEPEASGGALGQVRLRAKSEETAIDLFISQSLPPVLQGDRGLSQKGTEPGNASYYYSLVQQPTTGSVSIGAHNYAVSGTSWKDHEYSTSALSQGTVGWDWFSLQFNNGTALMLYGLRHEDGRFEPTSAGTFIRADGSTETLALGDFEIGVQKTWKSPQSKAIYPAAWAIAIPKLDLQLQGQALMENQELTTASATYWEGAVTFDGSMGQAAVSGNGYAELTGYADRLDSILAAR